METVGTQLAQGTRQKVAKVRVDVPGGVIGDEVNGARIIQILSVVREPRMDGSTNMDEWAYVLVELPPREKADWECTDPNCSLKPHGKEDCAP
jgi:hypothetical protein